MIKKGYLAVANKIQTRQGDNKDKQGVNNAYLTAVTVRDATEQQRAHRAGNVDKDNKEQQFDGAQSEQGSTDNCGKVHQHHDAVVVDKKGEHITQEFFVSTNFLECICQFLERVLNQFSKGGQLFNNFVLFFDIQEGWNR